MTDLIQVYGSSILDEEMKARLLDRDNIPVLEELLYEECQRYERLRKLKEEGELDFGEEVSAEELEELFPQVCQEVDDFLDIEDGEVPDFRYWSLHDTLDGEMTPMSVYRPSSGCVVLKRTVRARMIPAAAHEYAHSIHHKRGIWMLPWMLDPMKIFKEGHARGVERHLSKIYREKEDNEAFLYIICALDLCEFKSSYIWACEGLGKNPRESLLKTKLDYDDVEKYRMKTEWATPHAMGNALFSIYEAEEGSGIYRDIIHGEFEF